MRFTRRRFEQLEPRVTLSAVSFLSQGVTPVGNSPFRLEAGDINSDGRTDLLVAQRDEIAWYRNVENPEGDVELQKESVASLSIHAIHLADLDGDDDLDIIASHKPESPDPFEPNGAVYWFENVDGAGTFSQRRAVGDSPWFWLGVLETADMDGDDDLDVLLGTGGGLGGGNISWFRNDGSQTFLNDRSVGNFETIVHMDATDLDNDGDQDLFLMLGSDFNWFQLLIMENTGTGETFRNHEIDQAFEFPSGATLADLDGDGDRDVVAGANLDLSNIGWYENQDGKAKEFGKRQVLWQAASTSEYARVGGAEDLDADGDVDLLIQISNRLVMLENDGDANFEVVEVSSSATQRPLIADMDADGDPDIVALRSTGLEWFENRLVGDVDDDGRVAFSDFLILSANFNRQDATWETGDMNGDRRVSFADFLLLAGNFGVG